MHRDFTQLSAQPDDHSLQLRDLGERTIDRPPEPGPRQETRAAGRPVRRQRPAPEPGPRQETRAAGRPARRPRHPPSDKRKCRHRRGGRSGPRKPASDPAGRHPGHGVEALAHHGLRFLLNIMEQDQAALLDSDEMHVRPLAEKSRHLAHVLRQTGHRQRLRRIRLLDDESVPVTGSHLSRTQMLAAKDGSRPQNSAAGQGSVDPERWSERLADACTEVKVESRRRLGERVVAGPGRRAGSPAPRSPRSRHQPPRRARRANRPDRRSRGIGPTRFRGHNRPERPRPACATSLEPSPKTEHRSDIDRGTELVDLANDRTHQREPCRMRPAPCGSAKGTAPRELG